MNHLMLDLETMGTDDRAPVMALAGVFFDPATGETGKEFYETITLVSSVDAGARPDMETLIWWLKQSDEAREAVTNATLTLNEVLRRFKHFCSQVPEDDLQVWGNGPTFDCTILRNAYHSLGQPAPWKFWNERDVRTVVEMGCAVGIDPKHTMMLQGIQHNALHDARFQVMYVSIIWQKLTNV